MTHKQKVYRNDLLRLIHTHPKYKEIKAADAWEDWLHVRYAKTSSKDLSIEQLGNVIARLKGRVADNGGYEERATKPQVDLMKSLWEERATSDKSIEALKRFCKRVVKIVPLHLEVLTKEQATKIIVVLRKM
jgi:hypothetical protein